MKRFFSLIIICFSTVYLAQSQSFVIDTVTLGAGFTNDAFYSISTKQDYIRSTDWDLAFSVQKAQPPYETLKAATVRINGGHNVEIYKVTDRDTSGFTALDTAANQANWLRLYDSSTNWDMGALNATINVSNTFDYGWGMYNSSTYDVVADSIYVVKTLNGDMKKLWIKKLVFDSAWIVTYSDLNNSNANTVTINKSQASIGSNFIYLNMSTNAVVAREPSVAWDLLFTRYIEEVAPATFYPVNGVLFNKGVKAVKAHPVDIANVSFSTFGSSLSSNINTIGYDWKTFDMGSGGFIIEDSLVYFIRAKDNNIYRLRFLSYTSANAEVVFELDYVQASSVESLNAANDLVVYPNPTNATLNIIDMGSQSSGTQYRIVNSNGQQFISDNVTTQNAAVDVSSLANGIYFIQFIKNGFTATRTFVVNR